MHFQFWFEVYTTSIIRAFWFASNGPQFIFSDIPLCYSRCEKIIWTEVFFPSWFVFGTTWFWQYNSMKMNRTQLLALFTRSNRATWNILPSQKLRTTTFSKSWPDVSTVPLSLNIACHDKSKPPHVDWAYCRTTDKVHFKTLISESAVLCFVSVWFVSLLFFFFLPGLEPIKIAITNEVKAIVFHSS